MGGNSLFRGEEEEEELFFDSREDALTVFGSCPGSPLLVDDGSFPVWDNPQLRIWVEHPESIEVRKDKFMRWMGWDVNQKLFLNSGNLDGVNGEIKMDVDRINRVMLDDSAVVRSSVPENRCSTSCWSPERLSMSMDGSCDENSEYRIKSLDDSRASSVDEFGHGGSLRSTSKSSKEQTMKTDGLKRSFSPSAFVHKLMRRGDSSSSSSPDKTVKRRMGWLRKLGVAACIVKRGVDISSCHSGSDLPGNREIQRIKVHSYRKKLKEFSAVFMGQDIKAHDGAILTMKFSPDGQYLATGGEDWVVRVWRVMECEQTSESYLPEDDSSCIYFRASHNSELAPLYADKEKKMKSRGIRRTSDSACVVILPDIFQIQEKPVHEFYGHHGDVLDISWSKDKHLLTSSMDKTVRLWWVGCDNCLEVFPHNNYVTCVQFNPVDENYFISGSIDGKVRIWEVSKCRVVDWIDVREIVTAVCYRPDGKGGVVGTITGDCRFYDVSDNQLQLDAQSSLHGKKKSTEKRITGFQFCPSDQNKLMVTSADSQVRILEGIDVVGIYKGLRNAGSQISASFSSDGRHIVSASEDSNVYVWSHINHGAPTFNHVKETWSSERFTSSNASVAIPWNGCKSENSVQISSKPPPSQQDTSVVKAAPDNGPHHRAGSLGNNNLNLSSVGSFTLSQNFISETLPKSSATWPEENLSSVASSVLHRSHYKFLKSSCRSTSSSWGQVIVTAGWDGRIKSFRNFGLPVNM